MSGQWEIVLIVLGVLTAAIAGGAFFAFSNSVMPALITLPAASGASAMQAVNRAAPNPPFAAALLLGVVAGLPVLVAEFDRLGTSETGFVATGIGLSAVSLAITVARNVPKNNQLEAVDVDSSGAAARWNGYVMTWTRYNSLRGLASLASAATYAMSLRGR